MPTEPPLMVMELELAALPLRPLPPEVIPNVPVTLTRLMFAPGEFDDSKVPNVTLAPNVPLVETLMAPPVPVFATVLMSGEPTTVPLKPKKPGVLPTFKPRTVLPLARSMPFPAEVLIAGAVLVAPANVP